MRRKEFTQLEKEELLKNPVILKVLNTNIEFTQDFKDFAVFEHYMDGKPFRMVFKEAGIPDWFNISQCAKRNIQRWKVQSQRDEVHKRGRPIKQSKLNLELSYDELQARVAYLEEENEFLKKLEALEQQTRKKDFQ